MTYFFVAAIELHKLALGVFGFGSVFGKSPRGFWVSSRIWLLAGGWLVLRRAWVSVFRDFRVPLGFRWPSTVRTPIPHGLEIPLGGHRIVSNVLKLISGTGTHSQNSGAL